MNARTLIGAMTLTMLATSTWAAEDHSAHTDPAAQSQPPSSQGSEPVPGMDPSLMDHAHMHHSMNSAANPNSNDASHTHTDGSNAPNTLNTSGHDHHAAAGELTESEREHVPPDPPSHPLADMSDEHMIQLMQMEDDAPYSLLLVDQAEWRGGDGSDAFTWDAQGFYGTDYNKVWIKTEGDHTRDQTESSNELLWDHLIARWWSVQAGGRIDTGSGPTRGWAALGVQGLAPYWFDIEATAYIGDEGRTAVRISAEHDSLFTQRLVLQTKLELNAYGKDDPDNAVGSGLSDTELSLRLRYEFKRELAPYLGLAWVRRYGTTADLARADGDGQNEVQWMAGLRVWF